MHNSALWRVLKHNPYIKETKRGFPYIGKRPDGKSFSASLSGVCQSWRYYDTDLYNLITPFQEIINFGTGNPIECPMLKCIKRDVGKVLKSKFLNKYQPVIGDIELRKKITSYLESMNVCPTDSRLSEDNVMVTVSTTMAFFIILNSIMKPYDVVLFTAPTYGLFLFMPERINANVEFVELKQADKWLVNPEMLDKRIGEINRTLKKKYAKTLGYIPRVAAFVNINPHNPLGTVMGRPHYELLQQISEICKKHGCFIIDDLVYKDLTFNQGDALPIASIKNSFENTISMFGLSKTYSLPSFRAGMIVADARLINAFRNNLFYIMDSAPVLQTAALASAYDINNINSNAVRNYFSDVKKEYKFRFNLLKTMLEGPKSDRKINRKITSCIRRYLIDKNNLSLCLKGTYAYIISDTIPDAGFFVIVNFSKYQCSSYNDDVINTEKDLLFYLYKNAGIKFILGQSIAYPSNELIGRFSFSLSRKEIVQGMERIILALNKLTKEN